MAALLGSRLASSSAGRAAPARPCPGEARTGADWAKVARGRTGLIRVCAGRTPVTVAAVLIAEGALLAFPAGPGAGEAGAGS